MDEKIKILKHFDLTEYESKAYLALLNLISAKADEISKESKVPRSKIYSVLENLEKKGFINIKMSRPLEYTIIPPNESLTDYKDKLFEEINESIENMSIIYEDNLPRVNTPISAIEDVDKIIQKEYNMMRRSKNVIFMRLGFIVPSEIENLKKQVMYLLKRGVTVKILAARSCIVDDEEISIEDIFKDMPADIKYMNLPAGQLIIRDYKEMLLVFTENNGKSISNKNMIGLLNTYPTLISNYVLAFNKHWG
ncbi:TrmB family transcriptional regulator [Methanosphaera sp.]